MMLVSRTDVGCQSGKTRGREVTRKERYKWRGERDISSEEREIKVARKERY